MRLQFVLFYLQRLYKLTSRAWRIYINPPKESRTFLPVSGLPVLARQVAKQSTAPQPKQVAVDPHKQLAYVACMKGRKLQIFDYSDGLVFANEIDFPDQCVEVVTFGNLCLVTTTNFARDSDVIRGIQKHNFLTIIDTGENRILSSIETGGNWSKVIGVHPTGKVVFVSNWHTHDVSVINIEDSRKPRLVQRIPCGESPRGIAFADGGETVLVTGFYSGNIIELLKKQDGLFKPGYVGRQFDPGHYGGNMRDIRIDPLNSDFAWVSNLGRNLVHRYSISRREFVDLVLVGKSPNSLAFLLGEGNSLLLVSCRGSNCILIVDIRERQIIGRSEFTGLAPTGLAVVPDGFLVTSFTNNTLELYRFIR